MARTVHGAPEGAATQTIAEELPAAIEEITTGAIVAEAVNVVATALVLSVVATALGTGEKKERQEESICRTLRVVAEAAVAVVLEVATPITIRIGSRT